MSLPTASGPVRARVSVPGSKSVSNRALVCAALADGRSHLSNIAPGDDTVAMLAGLAALGIEVAHVDSAVVVDGSDGAIAGGAKIDAGLAGTTSRFLSAVCALGGNPTVVTGSEPLRLRPMGDLHRALAGLGARVRPLMEVERLPVEMSRGELAGGTIELAGDVSSQFLSALMMIGPCLPGGLRIRLTTELVSRPYVSMTARVMSIFGVDGVEMENSLVVVPEARYRAADFVVEADASSASYPLATAAIAGGRVEVSDLSRNSMQGDIRILDIFAEMGCDVEEDGRNCAVRSTQTLLGTDIDMSEVSDLVPTVAATALFASTPTRIRNVGFIRSKESDRLGALAEGITLIGGSARVTDDGLEVHPLGSCSLARNTLLRTRHDHRLAMAWSLIALRVRGISIDDPAVVSKSWPQWWETREAILASTLH